MLKWFFGNRFSYMDVILIMVLTELTTNRKYLIALLTLALYSSAYWNLLSYRDKHEN